MSGSTSGTCPAGCQLQADPANEAQCHAPGQLSIWNTMEGEIDLNTPIQLQRPGSD